MHESIYLSGTTTTTKIDFAYALHKVCVYYYQFRYRGSLLLYMQAPHGKSFHPSYNTLPLKLISKFGELPFIIGPQVCLFFGQHH